MRDKRTEENRNNYSCKDFGKLFAFYSSINPLTDPGFVIVICCLSNKAFAIDGFINSDNLSAGNAAIVFKSGKWDSCCFSPVASQMTK